MNRNPLDLLMQLVVLLVVVFVIVFLVRAIAYG